MLPGKQCRIYEIRIEQHPPRLDRVSTSLYRFNERNFVYCLITPMDLAMVPEFILSVNPSIGNLIVRLKDSTLHGFSQGVTMNQHEINTLQSFQKYLFGGLLQMKLKLNIIGVSHESTFLIAPLQREKDKLPSIHWELIQKLLSLSDSFIEPPSDEARKNYKINPQDYDDAVFVPWYKGSFVSRLINENFYTVLYMSESQTPESPFPGNEANTTYAQHFIEKYPPVKFIHDLKQPLLTVKLISGNLKFLKRDASYAKKCPEEEEKNLGDSTIELIPELGNIYPLPASLYIQSKFLPSVIQRIQRYLCAFEIQKLIAKDTPWNDVTVVGKDFTEEWRSLINKEDHIRPSGKTSQASDHSMQNIPMDEFHEINIDESDTELGSNPGKKSSIDLIDPDKLDSLKYGSLDVTFEFLPENQPTLYSLMQGITMQGSMDSVSLERLETMGDSFLKYCVSQQIFSHCPKISEGEMTLIRSSLVSNAHLISVGEKLKLDEYLAGGDFPDCAWLPPSFRTPELLAQVAAQDIVNYDVHLPMTTQKLETNEALSTFVETKKLKRIGNSKRIADSVEALIGAYFIHGGPGGALHFMERVGLLPSNLIPTAFSKCPIPSPINGTENNEANNYDTHFKKLEDLICYRFKQPWLLAEAFSHPCCMNNRVTDSYQRLEFLGDAVLDFLVTNHIFKSKVRTPGQLTDIRAALVNNVTLGSLSLKYGFQSYLLHTEKQVQEDMNTFTKTAQNRASDDVEVIRESDCHIVSLVTNGRKVFGDIFESLVGAVFVDSGMSLDIVWRVFYRLMKNEIDTFSRNVPIHPIRELNESHPRTKLFKDFTKKEIGIQDSVKFYVILTVPVMDENGIYKPVVGVGSSRYNASLAAATYVQKVNNIRKQKE